MRKYIVLISITLFLPLWLMAQKEGVKMIRVKKLSNNVNDPTKHDIAPTLSGDGKVMYFVRYADRKDRNDSISTLQDVWVTKRKDKDAEWQPATKLPAPINNEHHNVVCGTNYDGSVLFLSNAYEKGPNMFDNMKPGISVSFTEDGGSTWSEPITIDLTGLKEKKLSLGTYFYYHIYEDGFHLLVSFHHGGKKNPSIGDEDIYYCELEGVTDSKDLPQEYKDLINKGKGAVSDEDFRMIVKNYASSLKYKVIEHIGKTGNINSPGYETAPLLSHDSKKLYFTRQKGNDADKSDILFVSRDDIKDWDGWKDAYEPYKDLPEVIGFEGHIDSDKFDGYLIFEKEEGEPDYQEERREAAREVLLEKGYFSSSRNSEVANLYMFEIIRTIPFQSELIVKVQDCVRGDINLLEIDSLNVTLKVLDSEGKSVDYEKKDGKFIVKINKIGDYSITAQTSNQYYTNSDKSFEKLKFAEEDENKTRLDTLCLTGIYPIPKEVFYFAFDRYKEFFTEPIPASPEDSLALRELGIELSSNAGGAGTSNITDYTKKTGRVFSEKLNEKFSPYQDFTKLENLIEDLKKTQGEYKYIFISGYVDEIDNSGENYQRILSGNRALTVAREIYNRLSEGKSPSEKEALKKSIIIDFDGLVPPKKNVTRHESRLVEVATTNSSLVRSDALGKDIEITNDFANLSDFPNFRPEEGIRKINARKAQKEKSSK